MKIKKSFYMPVFLLVLLISVYSFIPWQRVYNVTSDLAVRESGPATAFLITIFIINFCYINYLL